MRRLLIVLLFLAAGIACQAQNGFGLEGTVGTGLSNNQDMNPLILKGHYYFSNNFSGNLGIGLINSGFKRSWSTETEKEIIVYKLSDNKTLPALTAAFCYSLPLGSVYHFPVNIFVEPGALFLPITSRTSNLSETHYVVTEVDGVKQVTPDVPSKNKLYSYESSNAPSLGFQLRAGIGIEIRENINLNLGYGLSTTDLFKQLRNQSISTHTLNGYLPEKGNQFISIGLQYKYNL